MPAAKIKTHTYHCHCLALLLASTHTLSSLPRRSSTSSSLDNALILPLPLPPTPPEDGSESQDLPPEGYTLLLGLEKDKKHVIIRREDGFEKRILYRCVRCRLVVGYELLKGGLDIEMEGMDSSTEKGKGREEGYDGKVMYILPAGVMSTDVMVTGRTIEEGEVGMVKGGVAVFE